MSDYVLRRFGPRLDVAGTRHSVGDIAFVAADDQSAIDYALDDLAHHLADCDYAALWTCDRKTIWEMTAWPPSEAAHGKGRP